MKLEKPSLLTTITSVESTDKLFYDRIVLEVIKTISRRIKDTAPTDPEDSTSTLVAIPPARIKKIEKATLDTAIRLARLINFTNPDETSSQKINSALLQWENTIIASYKEKKEKEKTEEDLGCDFIGYLYPLHWPMLILLAIVAIIDYYIENRSKTKLLSRDLRLDLNKLHRLGLDNNFDRDPRVILRFFEEDLSVYLNAVESAIDLIIENLKNKQEKLKELLDKVTGSDTTEITEEILNNLKSIERELKDLSIKKQKVHEARTHLASQSETIRTYIKFKSEINSIMNANEQSNNIRSELDRMLTEAVSTISDISLLAEAHRELDSYLSGDSLSSEIARACKDSNN